jgi:Icc-related predicted phosphoesterase
MKFRLLSDIHQEFLLHYSKDGLYKAEPHEDDKETVMIIAGDYALAKYNEVMPLLLKELSHQFMAVVYVLGNHEYWKGSLSTAALKIKEHAEPLGNVHVLDQEFVQFEHVTVIGATLWTDMQYHNPLVIHNAKSTMMDYKKIRIGTVSDPYRRKLAVEDTIMTHLRHREYIFAQVDEAKARGDKVVVVSHHGPTWKSVNEKFQGSSINGAYVSALEDLILDHEPDVWCHGHVHDNCDYMVGDCRVVVNPRGYYPHELNELFDPQFSFEL